MTVLIVEGVAKVFRKEGNISVTDREGDTLEVSVPDLELVVVVGERILVTSSAIITLLSNGIPVVFVSGNLDTYGVLYDPLQVGTVNVREVQYRCFSDEACRAAYAAPLVYSKVRGLYNILRYEHKYYGEQMKSYETTKAKMLEIIESIEGARDCDTLRKLEAVGSKYFWEEASALIPAHYYFTGREPRKGDAINSSVDFLYAILYGIVTKAVVANGLDPFFGALHVAKSGRLSLIYDFSEVFKPIVVHTVIQTSRKARLKTLRGSRLLTPRTIEVLVKNLYARLSREGERLYKRRSVWALPVREASRFKDAVLRGFRYEPFTYDPASGSSA